MINVKIDNNSDPERVSYGHIPDHRVFYDQNDDKYYLKLGVYALSLNNDENVCDLVPDRHFQRKYTVLHSGTKITLMT